MADQLQLRGGTTTEHNTFTGASKEVTVDTTKKTAVVHDGATAGGNPLMREDGANSALALGSQGTPSLKFTGDTNTGIYSPGADQLAISTNGTGRLFVASDGTIKVSSTEIQQTTADNFIRISGSDGAGNGANIVLFGESYSSAPGRLAYSAVGTGAHIFSAGGLERLRITSDGKLGLGTSSVDATFHVAADSIDGTQARITGATNQNYQLRWGFDTTNLVGRIQSIHAGTAYKALALNPDGGNVGIGTTTVGAKLHIEDAGADAARLRIGFDSTRYFDIFRGSVTNSGLLNFYGNQTGFTGYVFGGVDGEHARIDANGRLLVGTSSSVLVGSTVAGKLQVADTASTAIGSFTTWVNSANGSLLVLGKSRSTTPGSYTIVANNDLIGAVRFAADDGTDLDTRAAEIKAEVDGTPGSNDMPGRLVFSTTADGASSPTERMRITSAGYMLIGNISSLPSASVFGLGLLRDGVGGSIHTSRNSTSSTAHVEFYNPNGKVGSISTNGSATAYNTSSDYRLKENVVPLTGAIDRLNDLQVHRFNFIADPDTTVDGFLAHEAQAVVPECVTGTKDEVDDEGNPVYQGIDQSKLVPLLTAALQEALAEIESLKARVTALEP